MFEPPKTYTKEKQKYGGDITPANVRELNKLRHQTEDLIKQ